MQTKEWKISIEYYTNYANIMIILWNYYIFLETILGKKIILKFNIETVINCSKKLSALLKQTVENS